MKKREKRHFSTQTYTFCFAWSAEQADGEGREFLVKEH